MCHLQGTCGANCRLLQCWDPQHLGHQWPPGLCFKLVVEGNYCTVCHGVQWQGGWNELVSHRILTSCQPQRFTSGQLNCQKQMPISKLLANITPSLNSICKTNSDTNIKHTNIILWRVPSILPLLIRLIRLGLAGIVDQSIWFVNARLKIYKRNGQFFCFVF